MLGTNAKSMKTEGQKQRVLVRRNTSAHSKRADMRAKDSPILPPPELDNHLLTIDEMYDEVDSIFLPTATSDSRRLKGRI